MQNKLAPSSRGGKIVNFVINILWAVVWLGRSTIRIIRRYVGR